MAGSASQSGLSRASFEAALLELLNGPLFGRRGTAHVDVHVDATTLLFDTGVVDSLGIIDLLAFVEDATGRRVPLRQINTCAFGSVERIVRTFWLDKDHL
jgi:acyl carrier protein